MAKYICTNCNFIYDENTGFEEDGILPQTFFGEIDDFWLCPHCLESKENFILLNEEINFIEKDKPLNAIEKQHFIEYFIEGNFIYVSGQILNHPMEEEHYIREISFYDEYGDIIEKKYFSFGEKLKMKFDISFMDFGEIRIECSEHGIWSSGLINFEDFVKN